jgi:hypothetical protein
MGSYWNESSHDECIRVGYLVDRANYYDLGSTNSNARRITTVQTPLTPHKHFVLGGGFFLNQILLQRNSQAHHLTNMPFCLQGSPI